MKPVHEHRQVKVFLSPDDHDRVRLAAALRRATMAGFCRQVVLDEAEKLTKGVDLTVEQTTVRSKPHG